MTADCNLWDSQWQGTEQEPPQKYLRDEAASVAHSGWQWTVLCLWRVGGRG